MSRGGDSAIQEIFCRNCSETWGNHYSFDGMNFPATNEIVYVETETERKLAAEIERFGIGLSIAGGGVTHMRGGGSTKIMVENGSDDYLDEVDDIDFCPYCGTRNIGEDCHGETRILDESGYFSYMCYECRPAPLTWIGRSQWGVDTACNLPQREKTGQLTSKHSDSASVSWRTAAKRLGPVDGDPPPQ